MNTGKTVAGALLLGGFVLGGITGLWIFDAEGRERAQMEHELEQWRLRDWKNNLLEERRREFMNEMERKHL